MGLSGLERAAVSCVAIAEGPALAGAAFGLGLGGRGISVRC